MKRKNIFQLIQENYNIYEEAKNLGFLFSKSKYFSIQKNCMGALSHEIDTTLWGIIDTYFFTDWKYRLSCLNIHDCLVSLKIDIDKFEDDETIINFLELLENFIKIVNDNEGALFEDMRTFDIKPSFQQEFYKNVKILEMKMGLVKKEYKDKVLLYPKNAPLEQVLCILEDEDVQWELIRYIREDMNLNEKRKSLAYLATNLYIEDDKSETNDTIKSIVSKAGNILNNLHIRHNNKTGKWENKVLKDTLDEDAIMLCDMVFNEMLTIALLREHKKYEETYKNFNEKQKESKN